MIHITCPSNNIPERTYAIVALLSDVMGCDREEYEIVFKDESKDYVLQYDNKTIVVEDHFFNHYIEPLSYLHVDNIPTELHYYHALGLEIPIIYGEDRFVQEEDKIIIGLDTFASTFFMLTRWEESLLGREENGDCNENQLFVVKNGIFQRPIVHEYEELLRLLLSGCGIQFQKRRYSVVMSHDVDGYLTPSNSNIIKSIKHQLKYGPPPNKIINLTWIEKIKYKWSFPNDFCQFNMYLDLCKKNDILEWFYFKVCDKGEDGCTYIYNSSRTRDVVNRLKELNDPKIFLGFHPSQNTFGNEIQWGKEQDRIVALIGDVPEIGRNHHLLYNYELFRMWERMQGNNPERGMEISNCVFHNEIGFRSGTAVPYFLFDIYERRTMRLREHPCQIMDTVIRYHRNDKSEEEIWDEIRPVVEFAKRYDCELVLTWHIYIRNRKLILDYYKWSEKVVQFAKQQ